MLTTDTLVSRSIRNLADGSFPLDDTFFGETTQFNEFEVSDRALKLFMISENRLMAAAGERDSVYKAISFLREHSEEHQSMKSLYDALDTSIKFERDQVQLLCAENGQDSLSLGCWSSGRGLSFPTTQNGRRIGAVLLGSAMGEYNYITENAAKLFGKIERKNVSPYLTLINSYHQLVGIHAGTTQSQFGGAYVSAAMTRSGVVWQPDTTYFVYSPSELVPEGGSLQALEAINVFMRNELLYIERRTPKHRNLLLAPNLPRDEVEQRILKVGEELVGKAFKLGSEYKVFLSRERPHAVMVYHANSDFYVKTTVQKRSAKLAFSTDLLELLTLNPKLPSVRGAANIEIVPRGLLRGRP